MKSAALFLAATGVTAAASTSRHATDDNISARWLGLRHALQVRAQCNADNCARAVSATAFGTATRSARLADCSSFFAVTVTPATSTSTVTVTPAAVSSTTTVSTVVDTVTSFVTSTSTSYTDVESYPPADNKKRTVSAGATTVSPTMVPAYASACSGTARYSSACSCAGVTHSTSTAPTPVTVVTVTAATPVVVVDATATTTTTATATEVEVATVTDTIPCNQNIKGPYDGFTISVVCEATPSSPGSVVSSSTVMDWDACVYAADSNFEATSFEFDIATKLCTIYHDTSNAFATAPASGMVFAYFPQNQ